MPSFHPYAPAQIRNLPFDARRSQLFPPNPVATEQLAEDQLAGRYADGYFPQKMLFPKNIPFGSNVQGASLAADLWTDHVNALTAPITESKGIYTPAMAAGDLNRLPAPDMADFNPAPLARGLLETPIVQAPVLNAYGPLMSDPATTNDYELARQPLLTTAFMGDETPFGHVNQNLGRLRAPRALRKLATFGIGSAFGAGDEPIVGWAVNPEEQGMAARAANSKYGVILSVLGLVGMGAGLYHGWKRTHSTPWTVVWGIGGGLAPIIALPIMFLQGFGKRGGR